eukprot:CAMPEP_0115857128 /NCGR_PEP_ID=MMETSP0287-20121206/15413_1 /TAXON_ID=412157 /ORGANISM="Chrysochromulina rotalis, Strain UIO044" /LENGTH=199 /DNA_ID=CAMNT_0003311333 /DNA_START=80 /DNA_END=679 /DNA_ORIENTATION=-
MDGVAVTIIAALGASSLQDEPSMLPAVSNNEYNAYRSMSPVIDEATTTIRAASILHYTDGKCSTLATKETVRGFFSPATSSGSSYFCDPEAVSNGTLEEFGIKQLQSCFVDNGGNWYFQPLGLCAAFINLDGPFYVKFFSINSSMTSHQQFKDAECTIPVSEHKIVPNNVCKLSTVPGEHSYQIIVPDMVYLAKHRDPH